MAFQADGRTALDGQIALKVRMELLSDAIFGSGFNIPGGEDIAVQQDRQGWPYMKGSTFKGLLRESLENLLVWEGGDAATLYDLMGKPGWDNPGGPRRIHLTELTLEDRPLSPEECYSTRTFTSLDGGVVKTDTLRTASCIRQGLIFSGWLYCQPEDAALFKNALMGIKWVGTMRSRGFGRVRVSGSETTTESSSESGAETEMQNRFPPPANGAACIQYRIRTDSPVLATDMARSWGNSWETLHCIPGAAIRGALIRRWIEAHPDEAEREAEGFLRELLADGIRFSDVFPTQKKPKKQDRQTEYYVPLPSPIGFYEDKAKTRFQSILQTGEIDSDCKAAKLGHFCALENVKANGKNAGRILFWKVSTDNTLRILRSKKENDNKQVFETRYLDAGQEFSGSILLDNPALAGQISALFPKTIWLGADRCGGFGKCTVTDMKFVEKPEILTRYGIKEQEEVTKTLYLYLLSPASMLNERREPCGLDEKALAEKLGVDSVQIIYSGASVSDYSGYNSTWECRVPAMRMYDRGSIFKLRCVSVPKLECLHALEWSGVGVRRAEGYGQILFLSQRFYESLTGARELHMPKGTAQDSAARNQAAAARRARIQWVMEQGERIRQEKISRSQAGTIQSLCEKAMAQGGDWSELQGWLKKNLKDRGARHGDRFTGVAGLIEQTMNQDRFLSEEMDVKSNEDKLKLLCLLFDFSRKAKGDFSQNAEDGKEANE